MNLPALVDSRPLRFTTFSALYLVQGVAWGTVTFGATQWLAHEGVDPSKITAIVGLASIPWGPLKLLGAPLLDRARSSRHERRPVLIALALFLMGITLLLLPSIDCRTQQGLLSALFVLHNVFAAFQDLATDALGVDVLPSGERGRANSFMFASKSIGVAIGAGTGTLLVTRPSALFGLNVVVLYLVMAFVLVVGKARVEQARVEDGGAARLDWRQIKETLASRASFWAIAIAAICPLGYALVGLTFASSLETLGLTEPERALIGTIDPVAGAGGALLGGFMADRHGMRRTMGGALGLVAVALASFGLARASWSSLPLIIVFTVVSTAAFGAFTAAMLGSFMALTNPALGATQFAIFVAIFNSAAGSAGALGGRLATELGLGATFLIAALVQVGSIGLLPLVDPERAGAAYRRRPLSK